MTGHATSAPDDGPTVGLRSVSDALAQRLVRAGIDRSALVGMPLTVAVVDASGLLMSFVRLVGSPLATIQTAQDKAWTAVATRRPTHRWEEIVRSDEPLRWGIHAINRVVPFGGGYPIVVDGEVVGGLGVSGAHYDVDRAAAAAILTALELEVAE